jgi:mRNA interferase HicA
MDLGETVKRGDLIRYLEDTGFNLLRGGGRHDIYSNGGKTIPVKRQKVLDRVTANEICKQAGLGLMF